MSLIAILATDDMFGIGKGNDLAWHCSQDLQIFKNKTSGKTIVMGRKTLESLPKGKPLPNRTNIVMTRKVPENPVQGVQYCTSKEEVLTLAKEEEIFVIGGAQIYDLFSDHYDEIHETNIGGNFNCDVFCKFGDIDWDKCSEIESIYPPEFEEEGCIATDISIYHFSK